MGKWQSYRHSGVPENRYSVNQHRQQNIRRSQEADRSFGYSPAPPQNYTLPLAVIFVGVLMIAATFIAAGAGLFDPPNPVPDMRSYAPAAAAGSLRTPEPSETFDILQNRRVERLLGYMTTEQKVGQLLLLRSHNIPDQDFCSEISSVYAGGVVLFARDIKNKTADELTAFIDRLQSASDGNMLICVDEEGGTVVRVSSNTKLRSTPYNSPSKLYSEGGFSLIELDAIDKARFLRQFGFNVNFGPVADVVTDPDAMMFRRALGLDADHTSEFVRTVVSASESEGVATCLKHFPGYGNTDGDTHNGIVTLDTSLDELRQNDLLPFAAGIDAGSGAVMITHTIMFSIDPDRPASLSPAVISLLREEMGFDGVIISDGMDMGAISEYSSDQDVCVTALLAGVDLMCTPADGPDAFSAILAAVSDGTVPEARLDEAVRRILIWKLNMGLYPESGEYFLPPVYGN